MVEKADKKHRNAEVKKDKGVQSRQNFQKKSNRYHETIKKIQLKSFKILRKLSL